MKLTRNKRDWTEWWMRTLLAIRISYFLNARTLFIQQTSVVYHHPLTISHFLATPDTQQTSPRTRCRLKNSHSIWTWKWTDRHEKKKKKEERKSTHFNLTVALERHMAAQRVPSLPIFFYFFIFSFALTLARLLAAPVISKDRAAHLLYVCV